MNSFTFLFSRCPRAVWLVVALFFSPWLPGQGQTTPPPTSSAARPWSWATTVQHPTLNGYLQGGHTATDATGNQYITGAFTGVVAFGSTTLRSRSGSVNDLFVAKLSPTGQWLWAVSPAAAAPIADIRASEGVDIAVDGQGNVTVLGGYYGPLTLGSSVLPVPLYRAQSLVVARLSPQGQWLTTAVAETNIPGAQWGYTLMGNALTVDPQGNACVVGYGSGTMSFGTYSITGASSVASQSFAASVSPNGVWRWATPFGNTTLELVNGRQVKPGPQGDFWIAGNFRLATATFGTFTAHNSVTTGQLSDDVFLAHLSAQGQWLGVYSGGGNGSDYPDGLTVDAQNNVYVSGTFDRRAVFGAQRIISPNQNVGGSYVYDAFLAKLSSSGQWAWVQQGGGKNGDQGLDVALDAQGDVYWSGICSDTTVLGPTTLRGSSTFIAKLSPTGQWRWAIGTSLGAISPNTHLAPDPQNGIRVAALYGERLTLGAHTFPTPARTDVMGAHLSSGGQWTWAQATASGGTATIRQVVADDQGNTYATGFFGGTVVLGSTTLTSQGNTDAFIASYDRQGRPRWATQLGNRGIEEGLLIALDPRGGLVLAGTTTDTLTIGNDVVAAPFSSSPFIHWNTGFLARLNLQGQVLSGMAAPLGLARLTVAANGDAVLAGQFADTLRFGNFPPMASAGYDGFVARLSPTNQWRWARQIQGVGGSSDWLVDAVLDSAGNGYITGSITDTLRLGAFMVAGIVTQSSYLASFDAAGQWRWARPINDRATTAFVNTTGLALSPNGAQLLVSGYLADTVNFGPVRLTTSGWGESAFVGAMTLGGQWLGANTPIGSGATYGGALASGATSSYMLGSVYDTAHFGSDSIVGAWRQLSGGPRPSTGPGGAHQRTITGVQGGPPGPPIPPPPTPFVTGFTGAGQWQWAQAMPGAMALAANSANDLFVAGGMATGDSAITSGGATLVSQTLPVGYLTAMLGGPLGVRAAAAQPRLTMWPNPAHHTLHLVAPPKGAQAVRLLDGVGRVVFTQAVTGAPTALTLALPALAPGLYLVQCGGLTSRLVIE
jgi:hypothetical protein